MPTVLENAPKEVAAMGQEIMEETYPELHLAGVTVGYLFSRPAQVVRGQIVAGKVKKTNVEQRLKGLPDALIILDGDGWDEWTDARRRAVIDHELHHLLLVKDKQDRVREDEAERPKLSIKNHDFEIGGFHEIIERHEHEAVELQGVAKVAHKWKDVVQQTMWG